MQSQVFVAELKTLCSEVAQVIHWFCDWFTQVKQVAWHCTQGKVESLVSSKYLSIHLHLELTMILCKLELQVMQSFTVAFLQAFV